MSEWNSRRILKELVDADRRRAILADFWRFADAPTRQAAQNFLSKALKFRDVTIKSFTPDRKADLLASRMSVADAEPFLDTALMQYHLHRASDLMAAFLDHWQLPHTNGAIDEESVAAPDEQAVRAAVEALAGSFDRADVRLYLASAGLLMGEDWRRATWGVVDEMV